MNQQTFEARLEPQWRRFEDCLDSVSGGYRLDGDRSAGEFLADYHAVTQALALARQRGYSRRLIHRLNDLVVRGHSVVYARRSGFLADFVAFVRGGFALEVRRAWPVVAISAAFFVMPLLGVGMLVVSSPDWVYSVMSADQVSDLEAMYDPQNDRFGFERPSASDFEMFGFYIANNIGISFRVFASGLLLGVGTIVQLVLNGVLIGAAGGHMWVVGFVETFGSFVVGHGAFELTAIVLAGASGLLLGEALIKPGALTRRAALRRAGARAIRIVFGSTLMLVVAAFVEAFWSSSATVPTTWKVLVGVLLWTVVMGYFFLAGRRVGSE